MTITEIDRLPGSRAVVMFVDMKVVALSPSQLAHVERVFAECRLQMASYLREGVEVGITLQREVAEAPPYAIYVCSDPEFWVDCCPSVGQARELAKSLGLKVVQI